jgi:hypothetical protein
MHKKSHRCRTGWLELPSGFFLVRGAGMFALTAGANGSLSLECTVDEAERLSVIRIK